LEKIHVENLNFTYAGSSRQILKHASFSAEEGTVSVLIGPSGCGKTTILRQLMPQLAPAGEQDGVIRVNGVEYGDTAQNRNVFPPGAIGFVRQDIENQLVCDTVFRELAFGPENQGLPTEQIRRRVGELANYFGIQDWLGRRTSELSGGQKQILNLASVMVMRPEVLLLDEPTAELDTIAAEHFFDILGRLNRELGTTILLAEHRTEEAFAIADQVIVMEDGRTVFAGTPRQTARYLTGTGFREGVSASSLPAAMRAYQAKPVGTCPLNVREGRTWLAERTADRKGSMEDTVTASGTAPAPQTQQPSRRSGKEQTGSGRCEPAVLIRELSFAYSRSQGFVLQDLNLELGKGEICCLLGGNGSGKTTLLRLIAGREKPYSGRIQAAPGKTVLLPQNPMALFSEITVREELLDGAGLRRQELPVPSFLRKKRTEAEPDRGRNTEQKQELVKKLAEEFGLEGLLDMHPYDLSGGEKQRLAFAKLLLVEPEVCLLDEPTKGLDPDAVRVFGEKLRELAGSKQMSFLISTHEIEFAAEFADRIGLLFHGEVMMQPVRAFFEDSYFFTTAEKRLTRGILPDVITGADLMKAVRQL